MVKLIIFDLWDTVIKNTIDWQHIKSIVAKQGISWDEFIKGYEEATQKRNFGSVDELRKAFFEKFPIFEKEKLEQEFYELLFNRFDKINFFEDIPKTLDVLKNDYSLALLTNTESYNFKKISKKLNFEKYFDKMFPSFQLNSIKPEREAFLHVLYHFNISPEDVLMVGDSLRSDVGGANNVGIHSCWINRKGKSNEKGITPEFEINSMEEIFEVLEKLNK